MPDILTDTTGRFQPELTNFAIGAGDQELIGPIVAREVPTDDQKATYAIMGKEKYLIVDSRGGETDPAKTIQRTFSTDFFDCNPHRLREFISDQKRQTLSRSGVARIAEEEMDAVTTMVSNFMLEREMEIATALTTSGSYASGLYENLDTVADRNFDDSSGPGALAIMLDYLSTARQKCGFRMDTAIIAEDTWQLLRQDSSLLPTLSASPLFTPEYLAGLLSLKQVLIASALYTDDKPKAGAAYDLGQLWPSNSVVFCLSPANLVRNGSATIKTFMWNATPQYSQGRLVRSYRGEDAGDGGTWYQASMAWGTKLTGVNSSGKIIAGALLANCYSTL